jgi:MFS family permease
VSDARRVVLVRTLRGFADGFVSVALVAYLLSLGFSPTRVGVVVTGTLVGSAILTLVVGLTGERFGFRGRLLAACGLMMATAVGFLLVRSFVPLLLVAIVGTLNPSAGDVSVFLPTEQAFLAGAATGAERTRLYAIYNVCGNLAGAAGALATSVISGRPVFAVYGSVAVIATLLYARLPATPKVAPTEPSPAARRRVLEHSGHVVVTLSALFSLDAAGGGLVVTSILVLWCRLRFGFGTGTTAGVFFALGALAGLSQLLAPALARRVGLVRTMVFTHVPAQGFLILAALVPNGALAVGCLMVRAVLSQMDVPARQSLVMALVRPEERSAAASVTNVPRSLASAATPALAGWLLANGHLAAPLVAAGVVKIVYDLTLLQQFHDAEAPNVARGATGVRSRSRRPPGGSTSAG